MASIKRVPTTTSRKQLKKNSSAGDETAMLEQLLGGGGPDAFTLESVGAYMYFDDVTQGSSRALAEFVIKSNFIFNSSSTLTILINSYGGDVYAGFAAIDVMETSRLPIQTVGIGAICSMASLIFTAGTPGKRIMSRNSYIMTHQYLDEFEGKYHEFVAMRKSQDEMHKRFVSHFVKRTNMNEKQVRATLLSGTDKWINAKDALKLGLCDIVRDPWEGQETDAK
jgi:ATP-dependent Clp protease protease subunit